MIPTFFILLRLLIDFTDFYATIANAAKITVKKSEAIDSRSFYPQIMGEQGNPRDWQLCHYQPYWGKDLDGTQYVRNQEYKLYSNDNFFNISNDLKEENSIEKGNKSAEKAKQKLKKVLKILPPPPTVKGGRTIKDRPVYTDWENIVNPND